MKLFHGSTVIVEKPEILEHVRALDFGPGFYVTSSVEQASKWARSVQKRRRAKHAFLNQYEWDRIDTSLNILNFDEPNGEWLDFVVLNRKRNTPREQFDLVIGPVANDTTLAIIDDYMDGHYTKDEAIRRLLPQKLTDQYAFLTERAVSSLIFKGVEIV